MAQNRAEDPKVTPETPLEIKIAELFSVFDHSGKQMAEVKEAAHMIRYMGCCPTETEIEEIIARTSMKENPEMISLFRFMPFMVRALTQRRYFPATADELLEAFRYFDPDRRGFLTKERFTKLMLEEGEVFDPEDEFEDIMNLALDPVTDTVTYEYYVSQLSVAHFTTELYDIAEELEKERLRLEELKPKKRTFV